jgi:hypothetical protein
LVHSNLTTRSIREEISEPKKPEIKERKKEKEKKSLI